MTSLLQMDVQTAFEEQKKKKKKVFRKSFNKIVCSNSSELIVCIIPTKYLATAKTKSENIDSPTILNKKTTTNNCVHFD